MRSGFQVARSTLTCGALLALVCATGCPSRESVGSAAVGVLSPGVINDPANKSLRFDILEFGLDRFCFEMLGRGVPLKLSDSQPVLGRFFADSCTKQVIDDDKRKSLVVRFSGKGYAWTNLTQRIGFTSASLLEYAPDFQLGDDGAMYIYFRPKQIDNTAFQIVMSESVAAQAGTALFGPQINATGKRIVDSQLQRGFTVIRYDEDGTTEMAMGLIPKGRKPAKPFNVKRSDKLTLANETTEVHAGQQDYIGAFKITDDDQALYFTAGVDGAPAVDVWVMQKHAADPMIDHVVRQRGPANPASPPLLDEPMVQGQLWKRYLKLPKGDYVMVLDNSAVGRTQPASIAGDDRAASVKYLVQVGDAP